MPKVDSVLPGIAAEITARKRHRSMNKARIAISDTGFFR